MKTPMQELIDQAIQRSRELSEEGRLLESLAVEYIVDLAIAESMLEKEKEAIVNAWMDDRYPLDKDWVKQCAEQYYEETFNTKER